MDVVMVGAGNIGKKEVRELEDHPVISVEAVVDPNTNQRAILEDKYDLLGFNQLPQALDTVPCDLVRVATPPKQHYDIAIKSLQASKDVYIDKIMTLCSERAEKIVEIANERDLNVYVRRNGLYTPIYQEAMDRLSEIGILRRVEWIESISDYNRWNANKQNWLRDLPGGIVSEHLPHAIYVLRWFLHTEPKVIKSRYDSAGLYVSLEAAEQHASISYISKEGSPTLMRLIGSDGILDINHSTLQVNKRKGHEQLSPRSRAIRSNTIDIQDKIIHLSLLSKRYAPRLISRITPYTNQKHKTDHYRQFDEILYGDSRVEIMGYDGLKNVEIFEQIWNKAGVKI